MLIPQWSPSSARVQVGLARGSQSVVTESAALSPGNVTEMHVRGPSPDFLNPKRGQQRVRTHPLGDSDVGSRFTTLIQLEVLHFGYTLDSLRTSNISRFLSSIPRV